MVAIANEPIAVIGSACRFAGDSTSPSKLWQLLRQPREERKKIERFGADGHYHPDGHHHGTSNVRHAYFINQDPRVFDSQFFSISASEADAIDPQQRMLLETIYESIEAAGLSLEGLQGSQTAVYVGTMTDDYAELMHHDTEAIPTYAATGSSRSIIANRISYFFDWHGPSMSIDTACSSSLVAVHQAVQTLRKGESPVAVAAGSNLIFGPKMFIAESNLNMLSPNGRSRMWDADADGYARGEGIAAILMKPLSAAIADGDHIECIIRETGVNQDGRTPGITMPSSTAQTNLIRDTYARAGLDLRRKSDRPQYFEAHGTGTKAGDPQEARAIFNAFFGGEDGADEDDVLYVGSIKTVVGHTEGTAGLAGLLKASLAIQNKTVPPNLHFNRLNPDITPYYGKLQILTEAKPWPELPPGIPRRVSVNSFGFGGTNAHAIIESYEPEYHDVKQEKAIAAAPLVFSATTERSLGAMLNAYLPFLAANPDIDMRSLAWTLARRSAFPIRISFPAVQSAADLRAKIEAKLEEKQSGPIGTRAITKTKGILGVFTGQGAQWPAMGRALITTSPVAEAIIDQLEQSLAELPEADRPSWSLKKELLASKDTSRIGEGLISQPLCTAVQVMLVDLLRRVGIDFVAVVGHSSGEIAAAYAAGFLTARDAIRVAYYRGLYTKLARGPSGQRGAMMAAGTSMEDAEELCDLPTFKGRLCVAASNSSASVTLSGDADAIEHAKLILEDEQKFARALKVDTAYHSHHMQPCSEPYIRALEACNVQIQTPSESAPKWFSSVLGGPVVDASMSDALRAVYWSDNMLKPVLFSQALQTALSEIATPAIALEVGPHPALKGPASLTIEERIKDGLPYSGVLNRGGNDCEAFSSAIGFVWNNLGPAVVNFAAYDALFNNSPLPTPLKDLPTYPWDHERKFWSESRSSRISRARETPTHELLGVRSPDDVEGEYTWRNYLKPAEMPWLRGHQIEGQVLFPGAGFVIMCVEATKVLAPVDSVRLIEVYDAVIHRALSIYDEVAGVEVIVKLANVHNEQHGDEKCIAADFSCSACPNKDSGNFTTMCSGRVKIFLGESSLLTLPQRPPPLPNMSDVDVELFYSSLNELGYNYTDMFKGITTLRRSTDAASGIIHIPDSLPQPPECMFHPSTLDVAFQSVLAAVGVPGRLWSLHVPMKMDRLRLNPLACPDRAGVGVDLHFDATLLSFNFARGLYGDVDVYDETGCYPILQVEGLHVAPIAAATREHDRQVFAKTVWEVAEPDAEDGFVEYTPSASEEAQSLLMERVCLFYLRKLLNQEITGEESDEHRTNLLAWAANAVERTSRGKHPTCQKQWLDDTYEDIRSQLAQFGASSDLNGLVAAGERLLRFVKGESLDSEEKKAVLEAAQRFHAALPGFATYQNHLGRIVRQIAHRYPHMEILEVGAGLASVAPAVLGQLENYYLSYTYADTTDAPFDAAQSSFKEQASKLSYKPFDLKQDPAEQEFVERSYDLIIVSNALYASESVMQTLQNLRRLLKPGGYLALLEVTNDELLQTKFVVAAAPQWWTAAAGSDEDSLRPWSQTTWDALLQQTGFSGVDTSTPETDAPFSVIVSQAVDTQMSLLRRPLAPSDASVTIDDLLILGGQTLATLRLAKELKELLEPFCNNLITVKSLEKLDASMIPGRVTVLSLTELDAPVFKPFTPEKLKATQILLDNARNVLWVTSGSEGEQPFANMMIAIARCLIHEMPDLRFQSFDVGTSDKPNARQLAEALLRIQISGSWKSANDRLWTFERELAIMDGKVMIPRYTGDDEPNDRFNSFKRLIRKDVSLDQSVVAITAGKNKYDLLEYKPALPAAAPAGNDNTVTVDVIRSILTAFHVPSVGYLHLVEGVDSQTQEKVLAFSNHHRSSITVPRSWTVRATHAEDHGARLLQAMATDLLAGFILGDATNGDKVLVHEPTAALASALKRQADETGSLLAFTTSRTEDSEFQYIHPSVPDRVIDYCMPKDVSIFVNLSGEVEVESPAMRIAQYLSKKCDKKDVNKLSSPHAFKRAGARSEVVANLLQKTYARAVAELSTPDLYGCVDEITLKDVLDRSTAEQQQQPQFEIVNWKATATAPVRVRCAEEEVEFRPDRTYFLVGMTGELGLSLTQWMVSRGARYFALTSRNPKINPDWIEMMETKGAIIKTFAMDVTDKASILKVHQTIRETMPPIAGVANAAMVIADGIFTNIPYETMYSSLAPKVDGSLYLDEIFSTNDDLDFFILFSSITSITGNVGQSSYTAANAFMTSLAKGRRKRGLVGSVMNLAGIFGLGYVTRAAKGVLDRLIALGFSNICEWDFHQNFAEAVLAGHPDSGRSPELSAGLAVYDVEKDANVPVWVQIPKFARYRRLRTQGGSSASAGESQISIRAQLREQTTEEGVRQVLLDGLLSTLHKTLHMSAEDTISPDSTIVELGVDSLVAVDMRAWFSNELDLDMPVLKLLGGATIADLVDDAVSRLSRELIPNVVAGQAEGEPASEEAPAAAASAEPEKSSDESSTEEEDSTNVSEFASTPPTGFVSQTPSSQTSEEDIEPKDLSAAVAPKLAYQRTTKMGYGSTRFWFLRQYMQDQTTFNCVFKFTLTGPIRDNDADRAVKAIAQRHEAFRTAFFANADQMNEPTQGVLPESLLQLERKKIDDEAQVAEEYEALLNYEFDLERGETVRIVLLSLSPLKHFLIFCHHHIAMDGFSFNILLDELNRLYSGQTLPPVSLQFTDFVERQRALVESGAMAKDLEFWRNEFAEFPDPLPLFPVAKVSSRSPLTTYAFEQAHEILDAATAARIRDQARRQKSTTFHFFLAVLKVFLFRFLDIDKVCIGVADAGRGDTDTIGTIGFLLNLLPLQFKANAGQKFGDAVREARDKAYAALGHSKLPFDVLLEELDVPRSSSYTPMFQVFMDYRQIAISSPKVLGTKADATSSPGRTAYDLILDIRDVAGSGVNIGFRTQKSLYSQEATELLFKSYMRLVRYFASNPAAEVNKAPLFDAADIDAAVKLGRGQLMTSAWPATISERIESVARDNAGALALKDGVGNALTYTAMTERVDAIGSALLDAGVAQGSRVAVFQEPTADWVCTMLAIWKVGGVYVPLELTNSLPRLASIVDDCMPEVIVCHDATAADVPALNAESAKTINVSSLTTPAQRELANSSRPEDPAVILYTSGSTGKPKGIVLRHSSIRNEMEGYSKQWQIGQEVVLQQSAYTFDFSLDQMLAGLSNGGTVYVVPKSDRRDPVKIAALIAAENITYTKATPSEYSSWIQHGSASLTNAKQWRFAFGGGEPLTDSLKREFRSLNNPDLRLMNSYGPGEITISCTKAPIPYHSDDDYSGKPNPLGSPLPNYAMYVVDKNLDLVPAGVTGEIVIGGLGPAIGYLNNEELTRAKFIPDVYSPPELRANGWTTVYRSGDLGRLQPDGTFVFHGRTDGDSQVKLRGIRIELEDIESSIIQAAGGAVTRAVASVRGEPQFLVAHVEFADNFPEADKAKFAKQLIARLPLPQYMRPAMIIPLDAIPLNSHSKIDRLAIKNLPLPEATASASDADLTDTELALKDVWLSVISKDIAGVVNIDADSDFFHIGGNSLLLVKLQARIREVFDVAVPLLKLFESTALRAMAARIAEATNVLTIDWDEETALQGDLTQTADETTKKDASTSGTTVLLTGATGFLGRNILRKLVEDDRVSKIHCVAVRQSSSDNQPRELPVQSPKIVAHPGDLTEPLLGLSPEAFAELSAEVDVIIHSGANRSFWDAYQLLRPQNVSATKEVVRLAHGRKIPVHFISSGGVLQLAGEDAQTNNGSVSAFKPPVDGSMGYVATKWASEVYLENAARSLGVPVHIHRVTRPEDPTRSPRPELVQEFADMAARLKALPMEAGWSGNFDLIPVGPLAKEICDAAVDSVVDESAEPRFIHHASEVTLHMDDVRKHMDAAAKVGGGELQSFERLLPHKW
ncbi:Hybrid NRPS/PKS protein 1, partial [Rasamsonia emersonii CBS 393.64]